MKIGNYFLVLLAICLLFVVGCHSSRQTSVIGATIVKESTVTLGVTKEFATGSVDSPGVFGTNIKSEKNQPEVQEIIFEKPFNDPYDEISGMAWHDDNLIILPQWNDVKKGATKCVYSVKKEDILAFLRDTSDSKQKKPVTYTPVPLDDSAIIQRYETEGTICDGFEAIAFNGNEVFLLVELRENKGSVLIQGNWETESNKNRIEIIPETFELIPTQVKKFDDNGKFLGNFQYESIVILDKRNILVLNEVNCELFKYRIEKIGEEPYAFLLHKGDVGWSKELINIEDTYFRFTDATAIDSNNGEFWILNFNYMGDALPQPNDNKGVVARLVPFKYVKDKKSIVKNKLKKTIKVSWKEEQKYNWEGGVRLKGDSIDGFLMMNDGNPGGEERYKPRKYFDYGHLVFVPRS